MRQIPSHWWLSQAESEVEVHYIQSIWWNFPLCCGAVGGKHVVLKTPPNSASIFFSTRKEHFLLFSWQPITDRCPELRRQTFLLRRDLMRLFPGPNLPTDQQTFNYCLSPARPVVKKMPLAFCHHSGGCTDGPLKFIKRLQRCARGLSVFSTTSWGGRPKTPVRRKGSPLATHTVQCAISPQTPSFRNR